MLLYSKLFALFDKYNILKLTKKINYYFDIIDKISSLSKIILLLL